MALNASELANAIINNMNKADNPIDAHSNFGKALKDYIMPRLIVKGQYTGVLPNGNPDPASGMYNWKISSWIFSGTSLATGAKSGIDGWANAISIELCKITLLGADETGTITALAPTQLNIQVSVNIHQSKPDNMNDAMTIIAGNIIDSIKAGTTVPFNVSGASAAGTGNIVWGVIS